MLVYANLLGLSDKVDQFAFEDSLRKDGVGYSPGNISKLPLVGGATFPKPPVHAQAVSMALQPCRMGVSVQCIDLRYCLHNPHLN